MKYLFVFVIVCVLVTGVMALRDLNDGRIQAVVKQMVK